MAIDASNQTSGKVVFLPDTVRGSQLTSSLDGCISQMLAASNTPEKSEFTEDLRGE